MFSWLMLVSISCLTVVTAKYNVYFDKWLDEHGISADSVDYETWKANLEYVHGDTQQGRSLIYCYHEQVCSSGTCCIRSN